MNPYDFRYCWRRPIIRYEWLDADGQINQVVDFGFPIPESSGYKIIIPYVPEEPP